MTSEIRSRTREWTEAWDRLVHSSPDGWVFALSSWLDLVGDVEEWQLEDHSFGYWENGELVAVMPLHFSRVTRNISSSGWGGAGPVLRGSISGKHRDRLTRTVLDHSRELGVTLDAERFELALSPVTRTSLDSRWGVNPFVFFGLNDDSWLTQVVDLRKNAKDLRRELSQLAQRKIRDAERRGIAVRQVSWSEHLDNYYRIHVSTYTRTGVPPHPFSYFKGIAKGPGETGQSVLLAAYASDGEVVGYHNSIRFGPGAYYHTGCSEEGAMSTGANYLLFWGAILDAKSGGHGYYDCGWIFPNTNDEKRRGLTTFKTRFGGEAHRSFRAYYEFPHANDKRLDSVELHQDETSGSVTLSGVRQRFSQHLRRMFVGGG